MGQPLQYARLEMRASNTMMALEAYHLQITALPLGSLLMAFNEWSGKGLMVVYPPTSECYLGLLSRLL